MVRLLAVAGHRIEPLVVGWGAGRFGEDDPLILGSLHAQCNLQLLSAHIAGALRNICII